MPQTADFVFAPSTALAPGQYVSLVSNKDGVTKYVATVPSSPLGLWTINPKPPAGTYTLYTGLLQGALTTLVDPDYLVDPFDDQQNAIFPGWVAAGGPNPVAGALPGDVVVNRGGAAPGSGAIYFGSSAGLHNIFYDGVKFAMTDPLWLTANANPQYAPEVGARIAGASLEFGHSNLAGYGSVVGCEANSGKPYIAFNAGPGTAINSYKTLGFKGAIMRADLNGGFEWDTLGNANADSQAPTLIASLSAAGAMTLAGGLVVSAGGFAVTGSSIVTGNLQATGGFSASVNQGLDTTAAGQLLIGNTNATLIIMGRGNPKSLVVAKTLTALGAGAQTLTAAQLVGGVIEHTVTGAVTDTTDTGANLDALFASLAVGDTFECELTIIGAFTVTFAGGVGVTVRGTTALVGVAAGKVVHLLFRRTGASAWTCYVVLSA